MWSSQLAGFAQNTLAWLLGFEKMVSLPGAHSLLLSLLSSSDSLCRDLSDQCKLGGSWLPFSCPRPPRSSSLCQGASRWD